MDGVNKSIANNFSHDFKLYQFTENNTEWLAKYILGDRNEMRSGVLSSEQILNYFYVFYVIQDFNKEVEMKKRFFEQWHLKH